MIVWKETTLTIQIQQPVRDTCWHCKQPFVCIAKREFTQTVRGLPYVSVVAGAAGRERKLIENVRWAIGGMLPLDLSGSFWADRASCPHCKSPNPAISPAQRGRDAVRGAVVGAVVGGGAGAIVGGVVWLFSGSFELWIVAVTLGLGVALSVWLSLRYEDAPGGGLAADPANPRTYTDADWNRVHVAQWSMIVARGWEPSFDEEQRISNVAIRFPMFDRTGDASAEATNRIFLEESKEYRLPVCSRCQRRVSSYWQSHTKCNSCGANFADYPPYVDAGDRNM